MTLAFPAGRTLFWVRSNSHDCLEAIKKEVEAGRLKVTLSNVFQVFGKGHP